MSSATSTSTHYVDERLLLAEKLTRRSRVQNAIRMRIALALLLLALVTLGSLFYAEGVRPMEANIAPTVALIEHRLSVAPATLPLEAVAGRRVRAAIHATNSISVARDRHNGVAPPFSDETNCRRNFDRHESGDGFAWCGTSTASASCCRSRGDVACYYKSDVELCKRFLTPLAASKARDGDHGPGSSQSRSGQPKEQIKGASGGGGNQVLGGGGGEGGDDDSEAQGNSSISDSDAIKGGLVPIVPLLPAVLHPPGQRLPRLLRYPVFNLTWTRGGAPPRPDGWAPTEGQRAWLPQRDLKERYYRSCAVVGSSGTLRRSGYGSFIDAHEAVWRFNGAPAGGGYASDVGARTSFAVLADIATSECVDNKAKQPALDGSSPARTLVGACTPCYLSLPTKYNLVKCLRESRLFNLKKMMSQNS